MTTLSEGHRANRVRRKQTGRGEGNAARQDAGADGKIRRRTTATGSAVKQKEPDQKHGDEGRREELRRQAAEAAAKVTTAMLTTGGTVVGAKVGPSSIAEGELGLLATRRLEKFEVCSIYTGEIFRTGTAQPPETVPAELSRHTAAGGRSWMEVTTKARTTLTASRRAVTSIGLQHRMSRNEARGRRTSYATRRYI